MKARAAHHPLHEFGELQPTGVRELRHQRARRQVRLAVHLQDALVVALGDHQVHAHEPAATEDVVRPHRLRDDASKASHAEARRYEHVGAAR